MSSAYPISAPAQFIPSGPDPHIDFNASGSGANSIRNFVVEQSGDLMYRAAGTDNTLARLPVGSDGQYLRVQGVPVAQSQSFNTIADIAGSLNNNYFTIYTPTGSFYVWMNVAGLGTDPASLIPQPIDIQGATGIQVNLAMNSTALQVAQAVSAALNANVNFTSPVPFAPVVNVTQTAAGATTSAADSSFAPTGFTFNAPAPVGQSSNIVWGSGTSSPLESFQAYGVPGAVIRIPPGSWQTLNSAYVNWSEASPGHDAGNCFNAPAGIFTVPANGLYQLSGAVAFEADASGTPGMIPNFQAIRQLRILNLTTNQVIACSSEQASAFGLNDTWVSLSATIPLLTVGEQLVMQVRHDAQNANGGLLIDVLPGDVRFGGHRAA